MLVKPVREDVRRAVVLAATALGVDIALLAISSHAAQSNLSRRRLRVQHAGMTANDGGATEIAWVRTAVRPVNLNQVCVVIRAGSTQRVVPRTVTNSER